MFIYEKKLEYPVNIKNPNPRLAKYIITQYGGPDGELAASLRYLSQRFHMPTNEAKGILNDIGTEELDHLEMVGAMVHQLTQGVPPRVLEEAGLGAFYADHDHAVYPQSAAGVPFTAAYIQSKGDPIADLVEDLAAEEKARATYEHLINVSDDPDVIDPLRFLRQREVVHFQRFGEALRLVQDKMMQKNYYVMKPEGMMSPNNQMMNAAQMSNSQMNKAQMSNTQMNKAQMSNTQMNKAQMSNTQISNIKR